MQQRLVQLEQQLQQQSSSSGVGKVVEKESFGNAKVNKPSTFDGTSKQRVDVWLFEMEQYIKAVNVPTKNQVIIGTSYLSGAAKTWWMSHVAAASNRSNNIELITRWLDFTHSIMLAFKPINSEKVARDKLFSLKQSSSVIKYVYEFNMLCLDIPNISEDEKLDKFIRGLRQNVQTEVMIEDPVTLVKAMELAQRIDSIQWRVNRGTLQ